MAEDICLLIKVKDTLIIKPTKKSPVLSRKLLLVFAMICGMYICSICLKQTKIHTKSKVLNIKSIENHSYDYNSDATQIPYLHYPKPETFSRGECACNPVRFFAIISMQRSGSGWFETLLNSHVNVSSNGEIFSAKERRDNMSSIIKTMERVYSLDWLTSASKNQCSAAVGFKWMPNQGLMDHHQEIVDYFKKRGISAIFLFRRNLLRRMVSMLANSYDRQARLLNGTHKSHVHSTEEAKTLSRYKPIINSTSLMTDMKEMEVTATKVLEYFSCTHHMVLYYEDLVKDRTIRNKKLVEVQEFLGLTRMHLTSRQVKVHQGSLSDLVRNWDDVNKTLNGTAYESFLQADY